jgi:hypothetical protein
MSRETKAGLVVSCSFVCLVAVVLFAKWREKGPSAEATGQPDLALVPSDPTPVQENTVPPAKISKVSEPGPFDTAHAPEQKSAQVAPSTTQPTERAGVKPAVQSQPSLVKNVPAAEFVLPKAATTQTQLPTGGSNPRDTKPTPPMTGSGLTGPAVVNAGGNKPSPSPKAAGATPVSDFPLPDKKDALPTKAVPNTDKRDSPREIVLPGRDDKTMTKTVSPPVDDFPLPSAEARLPAPPPAVTAPSIRKDSVQAPADKNPIAGSSKEPNPFDVIARNDVKTVPGTVTKPANQTPLGQSSAPPSQPSPAITSSQPNPVPPLANSKDSRPADTNAKTVLPPLGAASLERTTDDKSPKEVRLGNPVLSPANQLAQGPRNSSQQLAGERVPNRTPDVAGSGISVVPAPVIIPAVAAPTSPSDGVRQAGVESYDEVTYVCRPNDTFRTISKLFFQTEKYERALALFNRAHPLAIDALRQNPPLLRPGDSVYIPEQRILDKNYQSVIDETANVGAAGQTTPANAIASEKTYRVRANGEMFYEIARRTLGNGERWQEIYRLNPGLDPKDPVAAGTQLRLPADARVDPADVR